MPSRSTTILAVLALVATALAGCLAPETDEQPALLSRVHTLTFDRATMEAADSHDDPADALAELLRSEIVVRVAEVGDYVLEYTDATGTLRTQAMAGLTPGAPTSVLNVDPLAPATLKRGEETVATRAGIPADWWRIGEVPLGVNISPGSRAVYQVASRVDERISLQDITMEEQEMTLESLVFELHLPIEGTLSWASTTSAVDGDELLVSGRFGIPASAGDLLTAELSGTRAGEAGSAGAALGVEAASANASAKLWVKDGQLSAAQFLGGAATFDPRGYVWADGALGELAEGQSCAGATKADRCEPSEFERFEEATGPEEKEVFDEEDLPRIEDEEDRQALALLERLFAQSIVRGDKASIIFAVDEDDMGAAGPDGPTGSFRAEFTIEAVAVEDVRVPAGEFSALKIVEETRTMGSLANVKGETGEVVVRSLTLDETVARTTFWLDAETYQPIKMVAETPIDLDGVLKRVIGSLEPAAWEELGAEPLTDDQWSITVTGEASYELAEAAPGARFAPLVALGLAHSMNGAFASVPGMFMTGMGLGGPGYHGEAYPTEEWGTMPEDWNATEEWPTMRAAELALASAGPITEDGLKTYQVASASEGLDWSRIMFELDDATLYMSYGETCGEPEPDAYAVCRDGEPLAYEDMVQAGDTFTIAAEEGAQLRVLDAYANAVILVLVVR